MDDYILSLWKPSIHSYSLILYSQEWEAVSSFISCSESFTEEEFDKKIIMIDDDYVTLLI